MSEKTSKLYERFTTHATAVVKNTIELLRKNPRNKITESILCSMMNEQGSLAQEIIKQSGASAKHVCRGQVPRVESDTHIKKALLDLPTTKKTDLDNILVRAMSVARDFGHNHIGTEHILLALIRIHHNEVDKVLASSNASASKIEKQLSAIIGSSAKFDEIKETIRTIKEKIFQENGPMMDGGMLMPMPGKMPDSILDLFAIELTSDESIDGLDPVIGRDKETDRLVQILVRKNKNNPLLLGEPGVGKTAIVEGLAQRISSGDVPSQLLGKKIYALDLPLLVAGTSYRGDFEGRVKQVIEEVEEDENIILFVDEMHNLSGAGSASGTMDAANILKPALARGELKVIGATTFDDYKKHLEKDKALTRRLQVVDVCEPSDKEALKILRGIRPSYESHHGVRITDDALKIAVEMSVRYMPAKHLPDKAIDLIDEASSKKAVSRKTDDDLREKIRLEKELEDIMIAKNGLIREDRYEEAIELKKEEANVINDLYKLKEKMSKGSVNAPKEVVDSGDIRLAVSEITKISLANIKETREIVNAMQKNLERAVVGQSRAITKVVDVIKRSLSGLSRDHHPLGAFVLAGESGVGKTYLAEKLASEISPTGNGLVKINMSEFGEKFSQSKMLGAPAGYVGYEEGGSLTEKVKRNPYSVVLFDEIEKAHPESLNILLQIIDEGELSDGKGQKIDFRNTVIILTTNIGNRRSSEKNIGFDEDDVNTREREVENVISSWLKPEIVNRLDEIVVCNSLSEKDLQKIASLKLSEIKSKLKKRGIKLSIDKRIPSYIARRAFEKKQGARAIERTIANTLEKPLADKIIASDKIVELSVTLGDKGEVVVA